MRRVRCDRDGNTWIQRPSCHECLMTTGEHAVLLHLLAHPAARVWAEASPLCNTHTHDADSDHRL
jgi:hypothetical protein